MATLGHPNKGHLCITVNFVLIFLIYVINVEIESLVNETKCIKMAAIQAVASSLDGRMGALHQCRLTVNRYRYSSCK